MQLEEWEVQVLVISKLENSAWNWILWFLMFYRAGKQIEDGLSILAELGQTSSSFKVEEALHPKSLQSAIRSQ
jgi:hypothetical protein